MRIMNHDECIFYSKNICIYIYTYMLCYMCVYDSISIHRLIQTYTTTLHFFGATFVSSKTPRSMAVQA